MEKEQNTITTELAKNNVTDAVIAKLKADFLPLKIAGIDDKEGYEKVHKARMICRDTRVLTEKICKKGREDAVKEQKMWLAKEKEVVSQVSEIETYLKKQEDAIDQQKETIRIRAERLLKLPGRKEQMKGIEDYLGKPEQLTDEIIMSHDDNEWNQLILVAKQQKLDALQKAIDDQKAKELLERTIKRENELIALGATVATYGGGFSKVYKKGSASVSEQTIKECIDEGWPKIIEVFQNAVIPDARPAEKTTVQQGVPSRPTTPTMTDEEKLFNFAGTIERLVRPTMTSDAGKNTLAKAEELLSQAINLLRQ